MRDTSRPRPRAASSKSRSSQAAFDYVVACTGREPTILVAEDLHWFDDATRELLAELMRSGPGQLARSSPPRAHPNSALGKSIDLRPLTFGGRLELIDALEGGLPEEERLALATRSDGVPLYLEELVRAGASASAPDSTAPVPGSVPAALYEPLVARLYATPDALPVAATAAAAGQEVDRSLLAEAMSIPAQELAPTLRDLVDAQIMQPVAGRGARYQFRHELLREVAYELQPPSWRRKVHSRLGDLLSRAEVSDWRVLASHFERRRALPRGGRGIRAHGGGRAAARSAGRGAHPPHACGRACRARGRGGRARQSRGRDPPSPRFSRDARGRGGRRERVG